MPDAQRLLLHNVRFHGPQVFVESMLGPHPFSTSIWYGTLDWDALAARFGRDSAERLAFHIAAFELNKLASLRPDTLSFGEGARFVTQRFMEVWTTVLRKVWAQWRWEHDLPDWTGPRIVDVATRSATPLTASANEVPLLLFGGGKDSLVAASLLERAKVPYATLTYAHSVYGPPGPQRAIIGRLLDTLHPRLRHEQFVSDDAFAAPLTELMPATGSKSMLAAETPSSIFEALPIALMHGHPQIVLAHEHSANKGNVIWDRTGEDVNHQWGKSWEAESLLSRYVEEELVKGISYFSILQPLSDVLIFELLRSTGDSVLLTHSCNVQKPWCLRCAKCAYVALGYAAHLPDGFYERIFAEDVLDLPENEIHFRQMLGLADHTPFECIGEIDEARLALALCAKRGRKGRAVELLSAVGPVDLEAVLSRYAVVHDDAPHGIPKHFGVIPLMKEAERTAHERIRAILRA